MTDHEWQEWVSRYSATFGLTAPGDLVMLAAWRPVFEAQGFTGRDLQDATGQIAARPPKWRSEHLDAIQRAVRSQRFKRWQAEQEALAAQSAQPDCTLCSGSGWVVVPHPACVADGEWVPHPGTVWWYTCAVHCDCSAGRRRSGLALAACSGTDRRPPLTLGQYERIFPGWQAEASRHAERVLKQAEASRRAAAADLQLGPLVRKIADEIRKKESRP